MASTETKLRIFISYARADCSAFAQELLQGLEVAGFEAFLDRHDIAAGEDWETRLGNLIQSADTIVFVVSPAAVASERCAWEIDRAEALSKRIIPIVASDVTTDKIPASLSRLNFIFFSEGHSFTRALGELATALRVSLDWIREHTRFGELARRWKERDRSDALLLRGPELDVARAWLRDWKQPAPEPTDLQRALINASDAGEGALIKHERARQARLRFAFVAASILFAALAVTAGVFAFEQRQAAGREQALRVDSEEAKRIAEQKTDEAYDLLQQLRDANELTNITLQREATALADAALAQRAAQEAGQTAQSAQQIAQSQALDLAKFRSTTGESLIELESALHSPSPNASRDWNRTVSRMLRSQALLLGAYEMAGPYSDESRALALSYFEMALEVQGLGPSAEPYLAIGHLYLQRAGAHGPGGRADFGCMPALARTSDVNEAIRSFRDALIIDPRNEAARLGLACAYQANGQDAEAERLRRTL